MERVTWKFTIPHVWASLVAKLVKNLPAMWETWLRSLGGERIYTESRKMVLKNLFTGQQWRNRHRE